MVISYGRTVGGQLRLVPIGLLSWVICLRTVLTSWRWCVCVCVCGGERGRDGAGGGGEGREVGEGR